MYDKAVVLSIQSKMSQS